MQRIPQNIEKLRPLFSKMHLHHILVAIFSVFGLASAANIVILDYITVKGGPANVANANTTIAFFDVPYASAPIGSLRFMPPMKPPKQRGVFDASSRRGISCMQHSSSPGIQYTEDCLVLDIYVPPEGDVLPLPVLVYIHGGFFKENSKNFFNGDNVLRTAGVPKAIVVVPNYRLNVFGFLASKELRDAGGLNSGLLDQKMALEWVQENIGLFGGDPDRVTLWGQSAGAKSVATHVVANYRPSLFNKIVIQSGGVLPVCLTAEMGQPTFDAVVKATRCSNSNNTINCLQRVSAEQLVAESANIDWFLPVVDGDYITQQPALSVNANLLNHVPALIMTTTDEGTLQAQGYSNSKATDFDNILKYLFLFVTKQREVQSIKQIYSASNYHDDGHHSAMFYRISDVFGDTNYKCPAKQLAQILHENGQLVYVSRFNHIPDIKSSQQFDNMGVYHGADNQFLWNFTGQLNPESHEDHLSLIMITSLLEFVHGLPPSRVSWPQYTTSSPHRLIWELPMRSRLEFDNPIHDKKCSELESIELSYSWNGSALEAAPSIGVSGTKPENSAATDQSVHQKSAATKPPFSLFPLASLFIAFLLC